MKKIIKLKYLLLVLLILCTSIVGLAQKAKKSVKKPLIVFVTGDHEYSGESTLPKVAAELEKNYGFRTKFLKAFPDHNSEENIPGLEALKEAGANIKGMAAIFTYGFDVAEQNFKKANVELYTLSNYENLLNLAVAKTYITEEEQQTLSEWNQSPSTWNV